MDHALCDALIILHWSDRASTSYMAAQLCMLVPKAGIPDEMSTFAERMEGGSGISTELIERYVLGQLSAAENLEVESAAGRDATLFASIASLQGGLEQLARMNEVPPPKELKQRVVAAVQEIEHEARFRPPVLHAGSVAADFAMWVDLPEMVRPADAEDIHVIPFADNSDGLSAVVWLVTGSPEETHTQCVEKFLILEGSCNIEFPDKVNVLNPGDVFSIPLHIPHTVKVTSMIPCKILLQRIAA